MSGHEQIKVQNILLNQLAKENGLNKLFKLVLGHLKEILVIT